MSRWSRALCGFTGMKKRPFYTGAEDDEPHQTRPAV